MRDARIGAGLIQSLSPSGCIGVGGLYARLLADAARSPLVRDRGSANQGSSAWG
jgi:hypothetical protein